MSASTGSSQSDGASNAVILQEILASLKSLQQENVQLSAAVDAISGRVNVLAGVKQTLEGTIVDPTLTRENGQPRPQPASVPSESRTTHTDAGSTTNGSHATSPPPGSGRRSSTTSKIILTSYPGQAGVDPLPMEWGAKDPKVRGPVVVSRNLGTFRRRNGMSSKCPAWR